MTRAIVSYLSSLLTFVACDMVWLGLMAPRFYRPILGDSALAGVNLPPAIAFYLLYPVGLVIFAVMPALLKPMSHTYVKKLISTNQRSYILFVESAIACACQLRNR